MRTPGFLDQTAPDANNSLQWLAQHIVQEPGFGTAAVKFWWSSLMGKEILKLPEVEDDSIYASQLSAYDAQNQTIQSLGSEFFTSGMNLKDLLVDMLMTPWFRTAEVDESSLSDTLRAAHSLADLGSEKLLTPERLQRKTSAITGFTWFHEVESISYPLFNKSTTGLGTRYRLYYDGIDSAGVTKRSTEITPLMSTVAMTHALESACPIVLREFMLPDDSRKLFNEIDQSTTPLTEVKQAYQFPTSTDATLSELTRTVSLEVGEKNIVASNNDSFCDWDEDAQQCRTVTFLNLNKLEVIAPGSNVRSSLVVGENSCGADLGASALDIAQCSVNFPFAASVAGDYSVIATYAASRIGEPNSDADQLTMELAVETAESAIDSQTNGAIAIKQKMVELHEKMLGKHYEIDSPEIEASYELFVNSWLNRKSGDAGIAPNLFNSHEACQWGQGFSTKFFEGLEFEDDFFITIEFVGGESVPSFNEELASIFLNQQGVDPLFIKQAWVTGITYLLTDYDYLYE